MTLQVKATLEFNAAKDTLVYTDITGEDNLANSTKYSLGNTNLNRDSNYTLMEMFLTNPENTESKAEFSSGLKFVKDLKPTNFLYNDGFKVGVYKAKVYVWYLIQMNNVDDYCTLTETTEVSGSFIADNFLSIRNGFADTSIIKIQQGSKTAIRTVSSIDVIGNVLTISEPLSGFTLNSQNVNVYAGYEVTVYALSDDAFLKCFQPKIAKTSLKETSCCSSCKSDDITNLNVMFLGLFSVYAQFESELFTSANDNIKTLLKICNADGCKC